MHNFVGVPSYFTNDLFFQKRRVSMACVIVVNLAFLFVVFDVLPDLIDAHFHLEMFVDVVAELLLVGEIPKNVRLSVSTIIEPAQFHAAVHQPQLVFE